MEEIEYKRCSICGELFPNTNEYFYYAKKADGILSNHCKKCDNACKKRWREKVKSDGGERLEKMCEQRRKYYQTHKEQHAEWAKEYAKKHTEQYKESCKRYRKKYPEKHKALIDAWWEKQTEEERKQRKKQYYQNGKEFQREYEKAHRKERCEWAKMRQEKQKEIDPLFDLKRRIRVVVYESFKRKKYNKAECFGMKTIDIIGCSYEEMKQHLAKTFKENYGYDYITGEPVHIDHIVPLSTAKNLEDIIRLNHYTNLQLLKPTDNLTKQDRLDFRLIGC